MISEISDAICVIDHENRVVWANDTFNEWFSHHGSMLGKKLNTFVPKVSDACTKGRVVSDIAPDNRKRYFEVECVPTFDENGNKVSDLIAFRDVTVLQTLLNISDLTISTSTPKDLLEKAIGIIGETLGYKTIAALLYESGELELAASRGYSPMLRSLLARQKVGEKEKGLAGRSAYQNKVIVKDIKEGTVSEKLLKESRRLDISTVMTVPLVDRGVLVGVLAVSTAERPMPDQINLLKIVCNQLSVSLRKILFEEELVMARDEMELYIDLMCHDITNANQVALGYLELLQGNVKPDDEPYVDCAISTIFRVNSLIDNVRKVRRSHTLSVEAVSLKEPLDTAIKEACCVVGTSQKCVRIESSIDLDLTVRANSLLRDLFFNILELTVNRIKTDGTIWITTKVRDNNCDIIFEDTGPGIPDNRKATYFAQITKSPRTGQTGLGGYLLSGLVRNFGGQIMVEDRVIGDPEKGSRIVLNLKKA